ncbi:MAG: hypothetical protein RLZZ09_2789 [Pseudomonadota bacterium]|jgi:hypothetical protein
MRTPSFAILKAETESGANRDYPVSWNAQSIHPNPRYYKYYWWVFWRGSPCDGEDFLTPAYWLPTKLAFELMGQLDREGQPYWVYNRQLPRLDPASPFDPEHPKWRNTAWAPAYDADTDEADDSGFK